jgi:hypothetical protein
MPAQDCGLFPNVPGEHRMHAPLLAKGTLHLRVMLELLSLRCMDGLHEAAPLGIYAVCE